MHAQARTDERFMRRALEQAENAKQAGEVPVGAVIVSNGRIIGRGHNQTETLADPTAHAEMIAITAAATARASWRLNNCTLYVTLEPCIMCAGALIQARIDRLVYGATDPKAGACGSLYDIPHDQRLNHRLAVLQGVLAPESSRLLTDFFRKQRAMGKK